MVDGFAGPKGQVGQDVRRGDHFAHPQSGAGCLRVMVKPQLRRPFAGAFDRHALETAFDQRAYLRAGATAHE